MILIDRQTFILTVITGSASQLVITNNTLLQQLIIKPLTTSTTYDFSIEDEDNNVIYKKTNLQSTYNDSDINIPSGGNWTLKIDNASVDETFKIVIGLRRS